MTTLREAIVEVYAQVGAPDWAAPNLDALTDVLRDLSWLPSGGVAVGVPELDGSDAARLEAVLVQAVRDSADGPRPIVLT